MTTNEMKMRHYSCTGCSKHPMGSVLCGTCVDIKTCVYKNWTQPMRNEQELCCDCANREICDDFKGGRIHACSDFGFERKCPTAQDIMALLKDDDWANAVAHGPENVSSERVEMRREGIQLFLAALKERLSAIDAYRYAMKEKINKQKRIP